MSQPSASAPSAPPAEGSLASDALSGFLVFLIALPLCLGISMASGFPPVAGVLTAIVGGVVVSWLGSAELTIKGPAAGLIVIALGAVTELGGGEIGYKRALAVGVVAAVIQIIIALTRAGVVASVMPPSVVHGMLAAIGVIIIAKQTPVMLGVQGAHGEPLEMLMEIPAYIADANPEVLLVGILSLLTLILMPRIPGLKKVPAPMVALMLTIPLGLVLHFGDAHTYTIANHTYELGPKYLVQLPGSLLNAVAFPDFSEITSATSIKYIVMFALVGSVESLLSVIAVDAMDPEKRVSDLNKDLLATGVGNLICSCIGGLPMISEIVRSKANIDAGAGSRWSNFFHGVSLLGFVALLPMLLQQIPLAALAAMLVYTGARLASPNEFRHAWQIGSDQLGVFVVTFLTTLATDLLVGVGVGLLVKLALHVARGANPLQMFRSPVRVERDGAKLFVSVAGPAVFTNLLAVRNALADVGEDIEAVVIDLRQATLVDHTFLEKVHLASNEWAHARLELVGLDAFEAASEHPYACRRRRAA
ncbi:MAG: SulP family inorganic anion transporter [Alphaproteobacteria bacterium]|nr:SulP family inorganic anion transporter [Alphaproteobacteria bacterium]